MLHLRNNRSAITYTPIDTINQIHEGLAMAHIEKQKHYHPRYRSLFWPMILIGVGTAWLLYNAGIFTTEHLSVIFKLWPLLLVAIGLDLLFGRQSPSRGATIGLAFVGFILALMYIGPSINLGSNVEYHHYALDVPSDGAEHLTLNLETGADTVNITSLEDSNNIFESDIWYLGELSVDQYTRDGEAMVSFEQTGISLPFGIAPDNQEGKGWNISINQNIPTAIDFNGGVGQTTMDLSQLYVTDVKLNMGVGSLDITLPSPQESYTLDINGGVGQTTVDVPDDIALQVIVSTGIGDIELPPNLIQISGDDHIVGEEGTWQTQGFDQAEHTVTITFDGGIGSFKLK